MIDLVSQRKRQWFGMTILTVSVGCVVLAACGGSPRVSLPTVGVGSCLAASQTVEIVACDSGEAAMRVTQEADFDPALFATGDTLPPGETSYECPEGQDVIEINQRDFTNPANGSYEGTWCVASVNNSGS